MDNWPIYCGKKNVKEKTKVVSSLFFTQSPPTFGGFLNNLII
jgi:hypothetical protein